MRDYADVLTIEQFGALMPIGTHQAGSERGVYIGRTARRRRAAGALRRHRGVAHGAAAVDPARRDARARARRSPPSCSPSRPSAAARLIVDVDPKPDHNLEGLPELDGRVHVIELSGDERYRGLLDPLAVAPEALREDLASSYLIELLPQAPPAWETQVRKAVRAALEQPHAELPAGARAAHVAPTIRTPARPARRCRCGRTRASRRLGVR